MITKFQKSPDENLPIATWNIRAFGDLTEKWTVTDNDSPKRNLNALRCRTDIISRFEVIAIQEVKVNIKSLHHLLKTLGPNWSFILTNVTKGDPGNNERMAFVFDNKEYKCRV